ncbi:MAG: hypothetical protein PHF21_05005, partial [Bacilli bacterium]|nr:hypothetical protein [Bacilli bacterium]
MKYIKYLFLGIFIILSFYLTEKIIVFLEDKNPIMKEISEVEHLYNTLPINAYIENNTIIPGIKGKTINKRKTFSKMENFGSFNEVFIFYNYIKPEI